MSLLKVNLADGTSLTINGNEWGIIASATHVAFRSGRYIADRLVLRENPDGRLLVGIEATSADGTITAEGEIIGGRSGILSAMVRVANRRNLPPWMLDRCLTQLRNHQP